MTLTRVLSLASVIFHISCSSGLAQEAPLRSFAKGEGASQVGIAERGNDTPVWGPQAIASAGDGNLFLLDQLNGRILKFKSEDSDQAVEKLTLPGGQQPTDLIAVGDQLVIWSGEPTALKISEFQPAGGGQLLAANPVIPFPAATISTFAQMGSTAPSSAADLLRSAENGIAAAAPSTKQVQWIYAAERGEISGQLTFSSERKSADIEINVVGSQAKPVILQLKAADSLGIVEILAVDKEANIYILVENISDDPSRPSSINVAKFNSAAVLVATFDVPVARSDALARRFITVDPAGSVFFLSTQPDKVDVWRLVAKDVQADARIGSDQKAEIAPAGQEPAEVEPLQSASPRTRQQILATALPFETVSWTVSPSAYGSDPDKQCKGFGDRVRRPWYLNGQLGRSVRGLPYCWGCKYSIDRFNAAMTSGTLAGNICTKENPRRDVAGVDCSSFVSEVWGTGHNTTSSIPNISNKIDKTKLRSGDVLNKKGSHVMIFLRSTSSGRIEVIQAATHDCNGKVCRSEYILTALTGTGYVPRRYRSVVD